MNAPLPEAVARSAPARDERRAEVVGALAGAVPAHALLWRREDTVPYECDGLTAYREQPLVVGNLCHPAEEIDAETIRQARGTRRDP